MLRSLLAILLLVGCGNGDGDATTTCTSDRWGSRVDDCLACGDLPAGRSIPPTPGLVCPIGTSMGCPVSAEWVGACAYGGCWVCNDPGEGGDSSWGVLPVGCPQVCADAGLPDAAPADAALHDAP
jgi:hypothetical protein